MPYAPRKPCARMGCSKLVPRGTRHCDAHAEPAWVKPSTAPKRITGRKLQAMRTQLFANDPLCAECRRNGRVAVATQRDHIKPLAEGGTEHEDNIQGLCEACHDAKSKAEAAKGRGGRKV